jgi:hypothetical protein
MLHDFRQSLALSQQQEDAAWWPVVYSKAFPGFASMSSVRQDGWAQRGGIDRVVTLKSGKTITVDEKVRAKDWGDIALERWSDRERKTPGWVQKDLACDFIAYAFIPSQRCYLLPFLTLRKAWILEGKRWCELAETESGGFRVILAENRGYTTESIAVPTDILLASIRQAMIVSWSAESEAA